MQEGRTTYLAFDIREEEDALQTPGFFIYFLQLHN